MAMRIPNETASLVIRALRGRFGRRNNLFDRLRLNVTYFETLVWHESDQIGAIIR